MNVYRFNNMSKLSKLYELRRLSQEFGIEWTEKQECQLETEEEHLIKNEVFPVVSKSIERHSYKLNGSVYSWLITIPAPRSRLASLVNAISSMLFEDVVEINPDPEVEHTEKKKGGKKVVANPRTRLRITMADGSIRNCLSP